MSMITELSLQKKRKDRYNLYLDGEFFSGINLESLVKNHLKVGSEVDPETLRRAIFESECTDAFERAADYVSRGRRSEREVRDYLGGHYSEEVADFAAEKLKSYRYVDDGEYLNAYFAYGVSGKGVYKIRQELKKHGLGDELVEERLANFEEDEEEARGLAQKFMRARTFDLKSKAALWRQLTGKGYSSETVKRVVSELFSVDDGE